MKTVHLSGLSLLVLLASVRAQSPNALPGLRLWLDAQDPSTLIQSGGRVVQWNDRSGNGFHATQDDILRQPSVAGAAINGRAGVHFDGAAIFDSHNPNDDGLFLTADPAHPAIPTLNVQRSYSIFMVSQYWGAIQGRTLQGLDSNWLLGNWNMTNAHFTGAFVGNNPVAGTNNAVASRGSGSLTDSSYFLNGRSVGRNANAGSPGRLALGTPMDFAPGPFSFPEPSQADIGEVLVYNRLLGDNETRGINTYLANRWGLARPNQQHKSTQTIRFTGADPGEGLDFQGNFVAAVNMAGPAVSIGNASFNPSTAPGANVTVGFLNTIGPGGWGAGAGAPAMGASANDQALNNVLNSINWTPADDPNAVNATVNGLIPGHAYKLQLLTWESCCDNRHYGVQVNGSPVKYDFHESEIQGANTAGTGRNTDAGTAIIHSFIAGSNSMNFRLVNPDTNGGDRNAILNGFTMEDLGIKGVATAGVITTAADIKTTGNFVAALDFGNTGGPKTINGLVFQPAEGSTLATTFAENTLSYNRPATGSSELDDVLHTIRWEEFNGEGDNVAIDVPNITAGAVYELTLMFSDSNAMNRVFDVSVNELLIWDDFSAGSQTLGDNAKGAKLTYRFTAESNELNIVLDGAAVTGFAGQDRNPLISALTLELIPEPGTTALAALAAGVLTLRRRRGNAIS